MCLILWDLLTPVQHDNQYILGWPPLRFTRKCPSETQEYVNMQIYIFYVFIMFADLMQIHACFFRVEMCSTENLDLRNKLDTMEAANR